MAINKDKNVSVMITMDKELHEGLESLIDTLNNSVNAKLTKSKFIEQAIIVYIDYLRGNINIKVNELKKGN